MWLPGFPVLSIFLPHLSGETSCGPPGMAARCELAIAGMKGCGCVEGDATGRASKTGDGDSCALRGASVLQASPRTPPHHEPLAQINGKCRHKCPPPPKGAPPCRHCALHFVNRGPSARCNGMKIKLVKQWIHGGRRSNALRSERHDEGTVGIFGTLTETTTRQAASSNTRSKAATTHATSTMATHDSMRGSY